MLEMELRLQEVFDHEIPLSRALGIRILEAKPPRLVLQAPLAPNLNHKRTAFAGSLNAVATLAGWGVVYTALYQAGFKAQVIIQESAISYIKPVQTDFQAICEYPPEPVFVEAMELFGRKGKSRLSLDVPIYAAGVFPSTPEGNDTGPLVVFSGIYVILQN